MLRARIVFMLDLFSVILMAYPFSYAQSKPDSALPDAAAIRPRFLKIIHRPCVPLDPQLRPAGTARGLSATHLTFAADAEERVPGIVIRSEKSAGRRPAVIVLHGTGDSKEGMLDLASELAARGFVALSIDGRYHGERTKSGYDDAILRAYETGTEHPFLYDTVWDVLRLSDYLDTRADVDPKRIGVLGLSKGGMAA